MKRTYSTTVNIVDDISIFETEKYKQIVESSNTDENFPLICELRDLRIPLKLYKYNPIGRHTNSALDGLVHFSS